MTSIEQQQTTSEILSRRARYVSAGVSTPRLVVSSAEGARVTDPEGRVFVDFAGGIACQNTGHRFRPVVEAIHEQADLYLHQCFMVGVYEPYVETCRLLAELSPCVGANQKSILVNSGAEAVENAVKIARTATGRPAVIVFDQAFHGRTLLTMTMTSKVHPYKAGFGPFAPEVYRAPAPYPYHGITTEDALDGLAKLFKSDVDPKTVACVVLEPVQGEGGFVPMTPDFPVRLAEVCRAHGILYVDDEVQSGIGRTGKVWAIEHYEGVEPDLLVSGKSIGGGLPARGRHRPRRADGRRAAGRPRRDLRRQPALLCGRSDRPRGAPRARVPRTGSAARRDPRARDSTSSRRVMPRSARCAGWGRCSRSSSRSGRRTARRRPSTRHSSAGCCSSRAGCTGTSSGSCPR